MMDSFVLNCFFVVLGPACIQRVHRYGKQQASTIVVKAHEGEEWYNHVYRSGDIVEEPTGAPQGLLHQVGVSRVIIPRDLKDQDDISNQTFNLQDQEHLMKVKLYMKNNGGWILDAVPKNGSCLFGSVRRGLNIPEEYTNRLFRHELAVFCAKNAKILWKQHSQVLRDEYGGDHTEDNPGPFSIRSYLLHLLKPDTWGDSICLDMISRMWGLRITVLDTSNKNSMHEMRIRHQHPMKDTDVVVLFASNYYSAAVKWKMEAAEVQVNKVQVKGLDYAPDLKDEDISDEEDNEDYVSIPFQKSWSTHDDPRPRPEQKLVHIPEEIYKYLAASSRMRIGIPLTNTTALACPFCFQEFRSSKVLRHHYRMCHKNIVIGDVELSMHEESTIQQDEHVQQETCVQLDDGNKTIVVGQMALNTHEESTVEQVAEHVQQGTCVQLDDGNKSKKVACHTCANVYNTKDTLKRHLKDAHSKPSLRDLHCTFCDKCTFKNVRVRKEHERYCSKILKTKKSTAYSVELHFQIMANLRAT